MTGLSHSWRCLTCDESGAGDEKAAERHLTKTGHPVRSWAVPEVAQASQSSDRSSDH